MSSAQTLAGLHRRTQDAIAPSSGGRFAARTAAAALVAYTPVLVASLGHGAAGWAAVLLSAAILASLPRFFDVETLACALVPTAALTLSGLVQPSSQYMAMGSVGAAYVARYALDRRGHWNAMAVPALPRPLVAIAGGYLLWAAVATATSSDRRTSLAYLAGMTFALGVAFWLVPNTFATADSRRRLLASIVAVGVVVVAVSGLLSIIGPGSLYGQPFGNLLLVEPTILHGHSHLVFPRVFGPYIDPGPYYTLLAVGVMASFALRAGTTGRARVLSTAAGVLLAVGLLTSYSRAGWLMVVTGGAVWTAVSFWRRRPDWFAASVTSVFAVAIVALLLNVLGAAARFDVQAAKGWPALVSEGTLLRGDALLARGGGTQVRGGVGLTERNELWYASLTAARHRPVQGYGPGTDATAIAPYLDHAYRYLRGVSSHSTWLRTLVEMGVLGALLLSATWLTVLVLAARGIRRAPGVLDDLTFCAFVACVIAFLADQSFETYLLGGLGISNLLMAIALGMVAGQVARAVRTGVRTPAS